MKITILVPILSLFASTAFADVSNKVKIVLNRETRVATVTGSCETLLTHEIFTSEEFRGYKIKIFGNNDIFKGIDPKAELTTEGSYEIISQLPGSAPLLVPILNIRDIEITKIKKAKKGSAKKTEGKVADKAGPIVEPVEETEVEIVESQDLRSKVEQIGEEWRDSNTFGVSEIIAGQFARKLDPKKLAELSQKNLKEDYKRLYEEKLVSVDKLEEAMEDVSGYVLVGKTKTTVGAFKAKDINATVEALAEGNNFSPKNKEGRKAFKDELTKVLSLLGDNASLVTLVTSGRLAQYGDPEEMRNVYSILFINKDTREYVSLFIIEGQ